MTTDTLWTWGIALGWIAGLSAVGFGIMVYLEKVLLGGHEPKRLEDQLRQIIERERSR